MPQDHYRIDDLPLEVEGIPIRETIREVFRDPANGKPDDISKAGCLALALISNQAGGKNKGHLVWNAWREVFRVSGMPATNDLKNHSQFAETNFHQLKKKIHSFACFKFANDADFSGTDFGHLSNFQNAQWGHRANFGNAKWGHLCKFDGAHWEQRANFDNAKWGNFCKFDGAYWGQDACFRRCQWGESGNFKGAHWGVRSDFSGARWGRTAVFRGAQWDSRAKLHGAQWDEDADFRGARWKGYAEFRGAQWGRGVNFYDTHWGGNVDFSAASWEELRSAYLSDESHAAAQAWAKARGLSPESLNQISFQGALFLQDVSFENRKFRAQTDFSRISPRQRVVRDKNDIAVLDAEDRLQWEDDPDQGQFSRAPKFHGCELHQDTSFEGATFPPATGSEEAALAYQTLKLAFSKQQNIRAEQRFFRLEMEEETLRETGLKRWLFNAYKKCSDFGFSISLPLKFWCVCVLFITAVYGLLSWFGQCGLAVQDCRFALQWLEFSLAQTLPLPGFDKLSDAARKEFWPVGAEWSFALSLLVIAHKTISLAFLFLIGLALRNLFKLK